VRFFHYPRLIFASVITLPREIPFAGHPTIVTTYAVAMENPVSLQEPVTRIELEFKIGVLPVEIHAENCHPVQVVMTRQVPTFSQRFTANQVTPCFNLEVCDLRCTAPI
jgi:trans-2,3-dihydro-3-hydroxyanthranilate isomerase